MEDEDNLTTPDAYVRNHGVEVERTRDPQYGQIGVQIKHNPNQSTRLHLGLEQAKELHEKLGEAILAAEYDVNAMWRFVAESYDGYSPDRKEWSNKDLVTFVDENHIHGPKAFRRGAVEEQS